MTPQELCVIFDLIVAAFWMFVFVFNIFYYKEKEPIQFFVSGVSFVFGLGVFILALWQASL